MSKENFATILTCMDGRVQKPGAVFMQEKTGTDYVDTITEPGMVRVLTETGSRAAQQLSQIRYKLGISLNTHSSTSVGVAAHEHCAGNDVDNQTQKEQLVAACFVVRDLVAEGNFSVPVWGMFIAQQASGLWVAEQTVFSK